MANSAWGHSDLPSGQLWKDCVAGSGDDPPGNNNRGIYICLNYYIPWLRDTPVAATFVLPSYIHFWFCCLILSMVVGLAKQSEYRSMLLLPCLSHSAQLQQQENREIVDAKVNVTRLTSSNGECARQRMIGRPHPGEPGSLPQ